MSERRKLLRNFIITGSLTLLFGIIGLVIFSVTGWYIFHPTLYIMLVAMGLGWLSTAIASILEGRKLKK